MLQDLFFKYSLNNFLHTQVEECIRLVVAWNNSSAQSSNQAPQSPSVAVRVKTPPTVEMMDPTQGEEDNEAKNRAESPSEKQPEPAKDEKEEPPTPTVEEKESLKAEEEDNPTEEAAAVPVYENVLLVDVSGRCQLFLNRKAQFFIPFSFTQPADLLIEFLRLGMKTNAKRQGQAFIERAIWVI